MIRASVSWDDKGFKAYLPKLAQAVETAPAEEAEALAAEWRSNVRVDTGAYRDGIYVSTHDTDGYDAADARVQSRNPKARRHARLPRPARKGAAVVGSVAAHDVFNEFGSTTIAADSAFTRSVDTTRRRYPARMRRKLTP